MGNNAHQDVARRWATRILTPGRDALRSRNLHDCGDAINSYGSHFEVGRILRDRKGNPTAWLLNGDTWGNTTSRHQRQVRDAVRGDLPVVTIPHSALAAAGIDRASVQVVNVQRDWSTNTVITKDHLVGTWDYELDYSDMGGWQNSKTGEYVARTKNWGESAPSVGCDCILPTAVGPWKPGWNWHRDEAERTARTAHIRARHGVWEEVRPQHRNTGRKTARATSYIEWELVNEPTAPLGYVFQRTVSRHWLGASLITAKVNYDARVKHTECGGTGIGDVWYYRVHPMSSEFVSGPLTEEAMAVAQQHNDWATERNGGIRQPFSWIYLDLIKAYAEQHNCRGCTKGFLTVRKSRTAYFLSGFDANETRPSYFFCELPPKVRPTTVEEAYETLKPTAVKLAEEAGRTVARQGDIFAVPMPGLTLRELKAQGGVLTKMGRLLGTNHAASEVVTVGSQTYARGTMRHVPGNRRPDHRNVTIGRQWSLIVKNTVPVSA